MRINSVSWIATLAIGLLLMVAGSTRAATYSFEVFENDSGVDVSGLDLTVDVTQVGDTAVFTFFNNSTIDSSITRIYFESALDECLTTGAVTDTEGTVEFELGLGPDNVPGGNNIGFATEDHLHWGATPPTSPNGINPGESLTLTYGLESGEDISCVLDKLNAENNLIALHVQSVGPDGESVSAGTVIPLPPAVLAGLGLLGLLGSKRLLRRKVA